MNWTAQDMPDQSGRTVLITGANSGIGYESAVAFAQKGAYVIMACRSLDKGERAKQDLLKRAPKASVEVMALDLGSLQSVRGFATAFNAKHDRLDILMNNAGIMIPPYGKTADGFESQFGTNHLGHFALTGLILPNLLKTPKSRIVTVSSGAYYQGVMNFDDLQSAKRYDPTAAYAQSKLANVLFAVELGRKLESIHADVISVVSQPGYVLTNLLNQPREKTLRDYVLWPLLNRFAAQTAAVGATSQLYAAVSPDVRSGEFYGPKRLLNGPVARFGLNARASNTADAARLWQVSEQLTGVHYAALDTTVAAHA